MAKKGKSYGTKSYPQSASETSNLFSRVEPLLTPDLLRSRYLHGVDVSDYSNDELKQEIFIAANQIELFLNITIFPTQFKERHPYDYSHYNNFSHIKVHHRPILSLQRYDIISSNNVRLYSFPLDWIDAGYFFRGQINILPMLSVLSSGTSPMTGDPTGASVFLHAQMHHRWISAFYEVEYTAGAMDCEGNLPVVLNDVIGLETAIEILSAKQNQNIYNSQSLSQDSISQSSSSAGTQIYQTRIELLTQRKNQIMERIKMIYVSKYFLGTV